MIDPADILGAHILVVDDAEANVLLLERMLLAAGYTSVATTTEPSAVRKLYLEHRYDLILLDLLMPGMDGFEVMRDLHDIETEGYLPVLVLTAEPGLRLRALQAGAKDFISKPFDQVEALTRIHNMLEVRLLLRESKRYGRLLERYDPLTQLPNRTLYRELLARTLDGARERDGFVSVLIVAMDRFKDVNNSFGRPAGDALLCRVAGRLAGCIGPMDTIARLEGDRFGLIVTTAGPDPDDAGVVARRVRKALLMPFELAGSDIVVTASAGIAAFPEDAADADLLVHHAEIALDEAKEAGRDSWRFYSRVMNARARVTLEMEASV